VGDHALTPVSLIPSLLPEPEKDPAVVEKVLDLELPSGPPEVSVILHGPEVGIGPCHRVVFRFKVYE